MGVFLGLSAFTPFLSKQKKMQETNRRSHQKIAARILLIMLTKACSKVPVPSLHGLDIHA